MSKIKVMDEILANKIAAGEVVERCASVVKELVENSIDAKSTEIKIELKESGVDLIKVTDNGIGMDNTDAVVAFNRHATSKIYDEDDLYRINTLGFRGEALASIASVSNVELKTSQGDVGTYVNIKGGKVLEVSNADARCGTVITVTELFYNTPARLKHMKSLYTELSSIVEYVNKIALSHPDIRFTLINNGNVILKTDGTNNILKTIASIYGIDVAKKMLQVEVSSDDYEITGYISLPEVNRAGRNHMVTLVNGRVVRNQELNRVINDGYHSYKPDNRYPIVVLNIDVDSSLIDVNIHPTKMDIKFSKLEELLDLVLNMIKDKLKKQTLIKDAYIEELDNEKVVLNDFETKEETKEINYDKFEEKEEVKYEELTLDLERVKEEETIYESVPEKRLPEIYPIGLVHGTYIICQNEIGMYMIDQHAAKERINYELFKEKLNNPTRENIPMLLPLTLELSNNEYIILKENFDFLNSIGFEIEEFGINSIVVKAHPTWLTKDFEDLQIRKIIELVIHKEKDFTLDKFNDHLSATLACKASIKANTNLSINEMESLINDLRKCKNPFNCPHGRPTIIY
ncbi:MAG: DNA mismatch repair endonuclease MutL, partial [Bacilli bacterium]|nr:DNA mismatch repair endonuclease MutL [Bacilli bacterium]